MDGAAAGRPGHPEAAELAGRLRIALSRLGHQLRTQDAQAGLTPTRLTTLAVLESDGPLRVGALAERLGISAPTMSRIVECLDERQLVRRTPDPDDHRAIRITLSAAGSSLLGALRRRRTGLLADRIGHLDARGLAVLAAALPVLEALAAEGGGPPPRRGLAGSSLRPTPQPQDGQH
ncbi:MarR family winged helix-turn-helix transcriptional regulator [Pseudonocardia hispaniensis]|uniref:MarR family winged helix-turn-helix transcriptional regulator n=1 Tax=Pseudonocardia hispaniensis TaxID=904933 RepID=A0ABW1IXP2_9PSEU